VVAWLSEVRRLAGRGEEAGQQARQTVDLHRAMDMIFWLPQAEAVLAQVEGQ
jgi:hypothetical protein